MKKAGKMTERNRQQFGWLQTSLDMFIYGNESRWFSRVRQSRTRQMGKKIVDAVCDRVTPYAAIWRKAETKYRTYKSHVVRNSRNSLTPAATAETAPRTFGTPDLAAENTLVERRDTS